MEEYVYFWEGLKAIQTLNPEVRGRDLSIRAAGGGPHSATGGAPAPSDGVAGGSLTQAELGFRVWGLGFRV